MTAHRSVSAILLSKELEFSVSRSSGPGGQNVNKVNSRVTVKFDIPNSVVLDDEEKALLLKKLSARLTTEGVLMLSSQEHRSQLQNKDDVTAKLEKIIAKAFEKKKARKSTRPSKGAVQERLKGKKQHGEKKKWRQRPE
jgi:ribosome-associated protein